MLTDINIEENAFLILEKFPCGTEIGIDYHSWLIGERFEGISNVSPGLHYLFFSVADKYGGRCPRTGVFFYVYAGDVRSWAYDAQTEEMVEHGDAEDVQRIRCTDYVPEVATNLAPYPAQQCQVWPKLTNHISEALLERLDPSSNRLGAFSWVDTAGDDDEKAKEEMLVLQNHEEHRIRFTKLPPKFPPRSTGACKTAEEITTCGVDSTHSLQQLISQHLHGERDVLGEMQYAFVCFLIAQVYDAFDHWKQMISLVTNCKQALSQRPDFFADFIGVVDLQTKEIPEDFFVDIVAQNNFLYNAFQNLFLNCECEENLSAAFVRKVSVLKGNLERTFQWEFVDDDEDLPVVVEL